MAAETNNPASAARLARAVRSIHASAGAGSRAAIGRYLDEELAGLGRSERIALVRRVQQELESGQAHRVNGGPGGGHAYQVQGADVPGDFVRLLLGDRASGADLSSPATMEKLAASLNTVFDSLNEIIRVMNATLGGGGSGEETIRAVIGGDLGSQERSRPLEEYLGQIRRAFLVSHRAFQDAAAGNIRNILAELDPRTIESGLGSGLKFGPLRKAEAFEAYEASFARVRKWFESARFSEDLLREFERSCQRAFSRGEGNT